jgi:hypothetical protein
MLKDIGDCSFFTHDQLLTNGFLFIQTTNNGITSTMMQAFSKLHHVEGTGECA